VSIIDVSDEVAALEFCIDTAEHDQMPETAGALRSVARALWAVRVLDAWAQAGPGMREVRTFCSVNQRAATHLYEYGAKSAYHYSPLPGTAYDHDAARLAAAEAVFPELPEAVRAQLGERP
jgi:hypothetical protein